MTAHSSCVVGGVDNLLLPYYEVEDLLLIRMQGFEIKASILNDILWL
jgi:hypothetical protein